MHAQTYTGGGKQPPPSPSHPRLLRGFLRFLASCFADSQNASIRPPPSSFPPSLLTLRVTLPFSLRPERGIRGSLFPPALPPGGSQVFHVILLCCDSIVFLSLSASSVTYARDSPPRCIARSLAREKCSCDWFAKLSSLFRRELCRSGRGSYLKGERYGGGSRERTGAYVRYVEAEKR